MSHSSRLIPTTSAAPTRPATPGPCFRTDAEGHIALTHDWAKLFSQARRVGAVALQTRHNYVRLIHIEQLPELDWIEGCAHATTQTGSLHLNPAVWSHASGLLSECNCCGTPGRVEILNAHGLDFLQLCALPACSPNTWADYLIEVISPGDGSPTTPVDTTSEFPCAPVNAVAVGDGPIDEILPNFISALSRAELPFTAVLQLPEVTHAREIQPRHVSCHGPVLTIQALPSTLQIGLPAVRQLAIGISTTHGPQLHLLGTDDALLLTLSASSTADNAHRWKSALRAAFPTQP